MCRVNLIMGKLIDDQNSRPNLSMLVRTLGHWRGNDRYTEVVWDHNHVLVHHYCIILETDRNIKRWIRATKESLERIIKTA